MQVPADRNERAEYIGKLERQMMRSRRAAEADEARYNEACEQAERLRRNPDETARANCTSCRRRPGSIPLAGEILCSYCYRDALADRELGGTR
jgi:septal ring factor EnvC (AmiA/AmiB activator)